MDLISGLGELGVNTEEALTRFMNNASLYERMLKKFPAAARDAKVLECFQAKDNEKALAAAHTLKGVTGNLSLTPLFKAYTDIVALLRADKPEEAEAMYMELIPTEKKIIECIENAQ